MNFGLSSVTLITGEVGGGRGVVESLTSELAVCIYKYNESIARVPRSPILRESKSILLIFSPSRRRIEFLQKNMRQLNYEFMKRNVLDHMLISVT